MKLRRPLFEGTLLLTLLQAYEQRRAANQL
jgi:hypothetical protein